MIKADFFHELVCGHAIPGAATSPGIAWREVPADHSSPQLGAPITVESRNAVLRDGTSRFAQLRSLSGQVGTSVSLPSARFWVEAASAIPDEDRGYRKSQDTSEAVAMIRSMLSLQIKELATVLGVSRPTIYSWLRDEEKPQPQNRNRIAHLLKFAKTWKTMSKSPVGCMVRNQLGDDNRSLVELLSESVPDEVAILSRMQALANVQPSKPKGIHEIAKRHGIDLSRVRESQAEFDVLTGKPFHED